MYEFKSFGYIVEYSILTYYVLIQELATSKIKGSPIVQEEEAEEEEENMFD